MKKYWTILAIIVFGAFARPAAAQISQKPVNNGEPAVADSSFGWVNFGLGLQLGYPINDYKKANAKTSVGIGGYIGYAFRDIPLQVGFDGAYMVFASHTERRPWSETIPDAYVDVTNSYSHSFGHLYVKLQPPEGFLKPYVEALVGFNYLATTTEVADNRHVSDNNLANTTNFDDFIFSYGVGAGAQISIVSFPMENTTRKGEFLIDFGVKYIIGNKAEYIPPNGLHVVNGHVEYTTTSSPTDIATARIGIGFKF